MSGGWEIGDLALKVVGGVMPSGTVARVVGIDYRLLPLRGGGPPSIGLILEGWETGVDGFWYAPHFRKIKPDAEPCEEEFTVLIKRMKPAKVKS